MPLWNIYHAPDALSASDKQKLSKDITALYTSGGLPAFYVVIIFHPIPKEDFFNSGRPHDQLLRIQIQHIAVHFDKHDAKEGHSIRAPRFLEKVNRLFRPICEANGLDWEFHIFETPRDLWHINGMNPPPFRSEDEKRWFEEDRPLKSSQEKLSDVVGLVWDGLV